jgi:hypothetical protein
MVQAAPMSTLASSLLGLGVAELDAIRVAALANNGQARAARGLAAALVGSFAYILGQYPTSQYLGPYLPDVIGAVVCFGALLLLLRYWRPRETLGFGGVLIEEGAEEQAELAEGEGRPGRREALRGFLPFGIHLDPGLLVAYRGGAQGPPGPGDGGIRANVPPDVGRAAGRADHLRAGPGVQLFRHGQHAGPRLLPGGDGVHRPLPILGWIGVALSGSNTSAMR